MTTFNLSIYESYVRPKVDNEHDLHFVCNQLSKLYKEIDDACVDNIRISKVTLDEIDSEYQDKYNAGCCGFADRNIVNPLTGNKFRIGFNFGH